MPILLTTLVLESKEDFDLSALDQFDVELEKALKELPQNEIAFTALAALTRLIMIPATKVVNNLVKSNSGVDAVAFMEEVAEKVNSYVDKKIAIVVGKVVKNEAKKQKVVRYAKAVIIVGIGIALGLGPDSGIVDILKELAPDIVKSLIGALNKKSTGAVEDALAAALELLGTVT
jgi:hypothetical protein